MHTESRAQQPIEQRQRHRFFWATVAGLTAAVLALYMRTLTLQSLVFEEGLSILFAARPLPQLFHTLIYEDLHPPLHYLLLHFWMMVAGQSELAVRMPSVFAAVLQVPLTVGIVREVWSGAERPSPTASTGRQTTGETSCKTWTALGIAAAALVGTSPFIAYYAQETRMYSLVAVLVLATTWAFLKATRTSSSRWWLAFSFVLAASLYSQYLASFVLPAFWLYALLLDRPSWRSTVRYTLLALLLCSPWIFPAYLQLGRLLRWPDYWLGTEIDPISFLRAILDAALPSATMRSGLLVAVLAAVAALLLFRSVLRYGFSLSERVRRTLLLALVSAIPLVLTYAAITLAPKFVARYTIVAIAPACICAVLFVYGLLRPRSLLTRALSVLLVVAAIGLSLRSALAVLEGRENRRDDTRAVAAYLTQHAQADDVVLLMEDAPYAMQYYYRGAAPLRGLHVGQDCVRAADFLNGLLRDRPARVWLALWHHEFADPTDMVATELLRIGREVEIEAQFFGYGLRAFDIDDYARPVVAYPEAQNVLTADFAPGLHLLGYDQFGRPPSAVHYVFYWLAQRPLQRNYSLTLSIQDHEGNEYLRHDQALSTPYFLPPAWPLETPIRGRVDLLLPADLPPLTYRTYLSVYDPEVQRDVDLLDAQGAPQGQALLLEDLAVHRASLRTAAPEIPQVVDAEVGAGMHLLGFDLPSTTYSHGGVLGLTLWWQSSDPPGEEQNATFRLLDSHGYPTWQEERPIVSGYPLDMWQSGEVNRAVYRLSIPSDLPEGDYELQVGIVERWVTLSRIRISAREHRYEPPSMQRRVDVHFEHGITLLGYDLPPVVLRAGASLTTTLYWQASQPIGDSYKVSVQLLSPDLRILAQDDSIPVRWTYPTSAWLPGEIITDEHELKTAPGADPGAALLAVVLYDERTGQRLRLEPVEQGTDHAILQPVSSEP